MKLAILASLVCALPAVAIAKPARPIEPAAAPLHVGMSGSCRIAGTPMFEIRQRSEEPGPTSTLSVYATGAWRFQPVGADGRLQRATKGCLDRQDRATVRQSLKAAPWTITYSRIMCFAYSPTYTEYVLKGDVKFRSQMCGSQRADDVTLQSIAAIEGLLPARR